MKYIPFMKYIPCRLLNSSALMGMLVLIVTSCSRTEDHSFDFTEEHLFTAGIEGPAVNSKGTLYAVNFESEGTIGQVDGAGNAELFARLDGGSVGNGIRFDARDNMYIADYVNHNVLLIRSDSRQVEIYAHHDSLNQPNDLAITKQGLLFASDPNWKEDSGQLWRVDSDGFTLLESGMGTTNGIEVSANGKYLYVNESVQRRIWRYDLSENGEIGNKTLFHTFDDHGLDGMRCDRDGNLYVCRYDAGQVVVLNPKSEVIRVVQLKGKKPTNIAFGGVDLKQCFVTMADRGCFETFYTDIPGKGF